MLRKKKNRTSPQLVPVPARLPPLEGLEAQDRAASGRRALAVRWTLIAALAVVLVVVTVLVLGVRGVYDGLRERTIASRQIAQQHFNLGLGHLEAGDYELAIAEFEVAARHDPTLPDLQRLLKEAEELAQAQVTPTSETRQDAAATLYKRATVQYGNGNLDEAGAALDELGGLDAEYQRQNVETMLSTAHYQLGLNAVREDRLDDADRHFQAVLMLKVDASTEQNAQAQINLLNLYKAALSHWGQDWSAAIQALKGLYALAPDYKDVQTRLHDAHVLYGQEYSDKGDWCRASEEYAAAVDAFPLEETVDRRDDAAIQCQAATLAPTAAATSRPRPSAKPTTVPTAGPTPAAQVMPTRPSPTVAVGQGRIVYSIFDGVRQRHSLYVLDLLLGVPNLLRENASQPAVAPGRNRLAFRDDDPAHLGLDILDLRTNEQIELTTHSEDSTPVWSPDAGQIVFASDKEGDRKWRIYVISPAEVRGEGQQWALGQMPAWSPGGLDSSQIAFRGCDQRGDNCGLWTMEPGGFHQAPLTTDASDTSPSWSPDGSQVAFISSRAGNWEVYILDLATQQVRRMTNHPATDVAPAWSPDGKRLAFLSNREGAWAVYVLEVKSAQLQKVIATGDPYPDSVSQRLAWLP